MDNLRSYKGHVVSVAISVVKVKLFFLLVYSLDLNKIEQVFVKMKKFLSKVDVRIIE